MKNLWGTSSRDNGSGASSLATDDQILCSAFAWPNASITVSSSRH